MSEVTAPDLHISRYTGYPLPVSSIAMMRVQAIQAAKPNVQVPSGLEHIIRPPAASRWLLPQLASITPAYIENVLRGALGGSHIQQWELFDLMEDTWPRLAKNLNELKHAVTQMDWQCLPNQEENEEVTPEAKEKCKLVCNACTKMRPDPVTDESGFLATIYDILDAWSKGVTVLEIDWQIRQAGQLGDITAPRATCWVHPCNYAWSEAGRLGLRVEVSDTGQMPYPRGRTYLWTPTTYSMRGETVEFPEDKFLIGISKAKSGSAMGCSMLRPLAWWWCASNFASDWLMNLAHLFGLPFRWATHTDGAAQATITKLSQMLENMGSAAWAVFPEGTKLELKDTTLSTNSPQSDLLDRADKNCDLIVLGQTLTSDTGGSGSGGGSYGLGKVHVGVKQERVQAAAQFVECVLNEQLVPSILRMNYGEDGEKEAPCFDAQPGENDPGSAEKLHSMVQNYGIAVRNGLVTPNKTDEVYFRKMSNLPPITPEVEKSWKENPTREPTTIYDEDKPGVGNVDTDAPGKSKGGKPSKESNSTPGEENEPNNEPASGKRSVGQRSARQALSIQQQRDAANVDPKTQALALRLLREDLAPLRALAYRLEAILTIGDADIRKARLTAVLEELPKIQGDMMTDPQLAKVIAQVATQALARTLTKGES